MNDDNQSAASEPGSTLSRWWSWGSTAVSIMLLLAGAWYLLAEISLAELGRALAQANFWLILLALATTIMTLLLKAWRWQFLLITGQDNIPFSSLFWAMMLGLYVNIILPILRLGEIARIYALNHLSGAGKMRTLSTLVVEKVLDTVFLGLTAAALLPFVILPAALRDNNPSLFLGSAAVLSLLVIYLVAFRAAWLQQQFGRLAQRLPPALGGRLQQLLGAGLAGLASLRRGRLSAALLGASLLIAVTSILTPYLLFPAFDLSLGVAEAAAIHVMITLALVPPSTPAKIGIFDGVVVFLLLQFGVTDEAVIAAYTIVLHVVLVLPLIVFGSMAAARTRWRWRQTAVSQTAVSQTAVSPAAKEPPSA